jgi:hypothetical protein
MKIIALIGAFVIMAANAQATQKFFVGDCSDSITQLTFQHEIKEVCFAMKENEEEAYLMVLKDDITEVYKLIDIEEVGGSIQAKIVGNLLSQGYIVSGVLKKSPALRLEPFEAEYIRRGDHVVSKIFRTNQFIATDFN